MKFLLYVLGVVPVGLESLDHDGDLDDDGDRLLDDGDLLGIGEVGLLRGLGDLELKFFLGVLENGNIDLDFRSFGELKKLNLGSFLVWDLVMLNCVLYRSTLIC